MRHSLLDDSLFQIRTPENEREAMTLPQVLARLPTSNVVSFEALQAHQEQAWYSFLVQLATMVVARVTDGTVPETAEEWRNALLRLAGDNAAAWHLVVEEVEKPAFLQPPVPEGSLEDAGYKNDVPTPDRLDVLVTSKNHDVKRTRITRARPEHWTYALITLQTMEGFLGRGNYGVIRMNGGFGNRPFVGLAPDLTWGGRFRRDLAVLTSLRDEILDQYPCSDDGRTLLWLEKWDGLKDQAVALENCDPYFVEVCRRIRLRSEDGDIACWRANSKGQRVNASDDLNGVTGDPWTPIDRSDSKALTLSGAGFTYRRIDEILLGDEYRRPIAMQFQDSEQDGAYLIARTLVRGQGKTEGLHYRVVPVPPEITAVAMGDTSAWAEITDRSRKRINTAGEVQNRVLRPAISELLKKGRDEDVDREDVEPWLSAFDETVDDIFFESLWSSFREGLDEDEAKQRWSEKLLGLAEEQFEDARKSVPIPTSARWRAVSVAENVFGGTCRQVLGTAIPS
jgi:CRISPR system Cascade subunit CasA